MKKKSHRRTTFRILFLSLLSIMLIQCESDPAGSIILQNSNFRYEIDKTGKNLHFTDRKSGNDYLSGENVSYCASVISKGKKFNITSASRKGNTLKLDFKEAGVSAEIGIRKSKNCLFLKVRNVNGEAESLTFINVPLSLEGMSHEPFAACALAMNLVTEVHQLPALQTQLMATCYDRLGMAGAEIALIGVAGEKILPVIREIMSNSKELPVSEKGGAWAQTYDGGYGSYLMNSGRLTEKTADEWIEMCRSIGFNQIDNHGGGSFFKFGTFELNKENFPDGWNSFKRINDRLHEAGISSILHTYSFFIDKNSEYVTPVPHEELGYFTSFTLAEPVGAGDDEITVKESTADISTTVGFWVRNSVTLRLGSELVVFTGVTKTPPYKFTGCKRGALGTKATEHKTDVKAFQLMEMFGRFVPGGETALFDEVAKRTADIVNDCNFDGIYFDAIDGSDLFGGEEFYWYYGPKFVTEVAKNLKTPVMMEMAGMTHNWWRFRSRWQAWDSPVRGFKRFVDIHLASIKSDTYKHGEFLGHSPVIDKLARAEQSPLLLPLHLGWWRNQTWSPSPQMEMTFTDDLEYLCCKMIGNNAGLSGLSGADKKSVEANPLFGRLHTLLKQYEELRHQNYFSDSVRTLLREPGKEFTLFREVNDSWNFKPVFYRKQKVADKDDPSAKWIVSNEFGKQPVKLRIQALMSVKPFNDRSNILLTEYKGSDSDFPAKANATGVEGKLSRSGELTGPVSNIVDFTALSSGVSPREGSWIKMEKIFDPWLDLSNNQAIGVWIKGDGNGQLLNFRTGNPMQIGYAGVRGDHFVKIDFTGWKYFELVEIESTEFSNYIWDQAVATRQITEGFNVYNSYRGTVQFNSIDKLQLWYNNLPQGKEVKCTIGPVKALQMVPVTITNPSVTVGGETIVFPVEMESGMYLELKSQNDCKLYGPRGELIKEVSVSGKMPELQPGENEVSFDCEGTAGISSRVQVTVIGEGDPL
jgi:hypothetical protein